MESDDILRALSGGIGHDFDVSDSEVESRLGVSLIDARRRQTQRRIAAGTAAAVLLTGVVLTAFSLGSRDRNVVPANTSTTSLPSVSTTTTVLTSTTVKPVAVAVDIKNLITISGIGSENATRLNINDKTTGKLVKTIVDTKTNQTIKNIDKTTPNESIQSVSMSTQRDRIAFSTLSESDARHLWMINADGSGLKYLGVGDTPAISPDGTKLGYRGNGDTYLWPIIRDLSTGREEQLVYPDADLNNPTVVDSFDWSADSSKLLLSVSHVHSSGTSDGGVVVIPSTGKTDVTKLSLIHPKNLGFTNAKFINSTTVIGNLFDTTMAGEPYDLVLMTLDGNITKHLKFAGSTVLGIDTDPTTGQIAVVSGDMGSSDNSLQIGTVNGLGSVLAIKVDDVAL